MNAATTTTSAIPNRRPGLLGPVLLLTAAILGAAILGCSRNLNERTVEERVHANDYYRTEAGYDLQNGRVVDAVAGYCEAVRIWPYDAESSWTLARIYAGLGPDYARYSAVMALKAREAAPDPYGEQEVEPMPIENADAVRAVLRPSPALIPRPMDDPLDPTSSSR